MSVPALVVAFSGGKDSTALALRLHELGEPFRLLFTPTGNELPPLRAHIERVVALSGAELVLPPNRSLREWIDTFEALPNFRQRWCTRVIKIEPCVAWLRANPGTTLAVGLRADEEARVGLYGEHATYRYPLREWGWGLAEVLAYLRRQAVSVPKRTDCALCPYQRLGEWFELWREQPEAFAEGVALEDRIGHTFRSPSRDSWPAKLVELDALFRRGIRPKHADQLPLFGEDEQACRVCRM